MECSNPTQWYACDYCSQTSVHIMGKFVEIVILPLEFGTVLDAVHEESIHFFFSNRSIVILINEYQ